MSREVKRNVPMSIKTRLLQQSQESGMDYMKILVRYLHERLLYRVSISSYREQLLLKGSSLLYAYERWDAISPNGKYNIRTSFRYQIIRCYRQPDTMCCVSVVRSV